MVALEYLKSLPRQFLPPQVERGISLASNGDLKRWLIMKAIIINGETPQPSDPIILPITQLVFFPNGKRRTTIIDERRNAH